MKVHNYYATLSVDRCATDAEIKQAYRALAHRFHPDVSNDQDGERKFKEVTEAYRTLKLPESRIAYDLQIHNYCGGMKAARVAVPSEMEFFNYGFIFLAYWSWLIPLHAGSPKQ